MDPFLPSRHAQWLNVCVVGGSVVSTTVLAPGADLHGAFLEVLEAHRVDGWILETEPTYPCVFLHRNRERRMVTLCQVDPGGVSLRHFSPWVS